METFDTVFESTVPVLVGVNAGLLATGSVLGTAVTGEARSGVYFAPEASPTFCIIPSGVRSPSERAVIWTW
jgi:hypothetical protein